jgi:hypothetical protein
MTSYVEIRDRIKPRLETATDVPVLALGTNSDNSAFVIENEAGHLFVTGPAHTLGADAQAKWEKANAANEAYLYIQGRYVEADNPNRNLAYWSAEDLQIGQPSVVNGPLNWLHSERHIVGVLTDSRIVDREHAAEGVGTHIQATSALWRFLYPDEASVVEKASLDNALWYSMECTSETVTCMDTPGRPGCGETFSYAAAVRKEGVCSHIREKSSVRRYGNPTFLGAAVIVPPVTPAWGSADAAVQRQAAMTVERASLTEQMSKKDAEAMVSMLLQYANGR